MARVDRSFAIRAEEVVAAEIVEPWHSGRHEVVEGGLEIMNDEGTNLTLMANAAAIVYLDMPEKK